MFATARGKVDPRSMNVRGFFLEAKIMWTYQAVLLTAEPGQCRYVCVITFNGQRTQDDCLHAHSSMRHTEWKNCEVPDRPLTSQAYHTIVKDAKVIRRYRAGMQTGIYVDESF